MYFLLLVIFVMYQDIYKINYIFLQKIKQKIGTSTSRTMDFFSFCQDGDSILNCDEGRETLKRVGIYSTSKVGEWIEKELRDHMQHEKIAEALHKFLSEPSGNFLIDILLL